MIPFTNLALFLWKASVLNNFLSRFVRTTRNFPQSIFHYVVVSMLGSTFKLSIKYENYVHLLLFPLKFSMLFNLSILNHITLLSFLRCLLNVLGDVVEKFGKMYSSSVRPKNSSRLRPTVMTFWTMKMEIKLMENEIVQIRLSFSLWSENQTKNSQFTFFCLFFFHFSAT